MHKKNVTTRRKVTGSVPTEHQEGVALMQWAQFHSIARKFLFHIPNGGARAIATARNLKAEGVKPGIPDYFLPYPSNGRPGLFIELKRQKGGVVSPEQKEWIRRLKSVGYAVHVAKGWEECVKIILEYLGDHLSTSSENVIRKMSYGGTTISLDF